MTNRALLQAAAVCVTAVLFSATAIAQGRGGSTEDIGKQEYMNSCAVCHGAKGKGDGPYADRLKARPADLTLIQKNNVGVFPFDRLYGVIDGREAIEAHGARDMPVWGDIYSGRGGSYLFGFATPKDLESYTRGQIIALIGYVYSLQEK